MKSALRAATLAAVALTAGCAEMRWTKAGADAAAVARDQDECRAQALRRGPPPVAGVGSPDARTDGSRPAGMTTAQGSNERFIAENEEMRRCMLQRGYQLTPAM